MLEIHILYWLQVMRPQQSETGYRGRK